VKGIHGIDMNSKHSKPNDIFTDVGYKESEKYHSEGSRKEKASLR